MEKEKSQISDVTIFLMVFSALCFDGIQAVIGWIPFFGNILAALLDIFIFLTFFLWFKIHGISMMTPKRISSLVGGGIAEIIPFFNVLPIWTGVVIYLISTTKIREVLPDGSGLTKKLTKSVYK
jgi:hypothetical protein